MWRQLLKFYYENNAIVNQGFFHPEKAKWDPNDPERNRRGLFPEWNTRG